MQLETADITSFIHAHAFIVYQMFELYDKISDILADELSKTSYWGAIYSLITGENRFIIPDSRTQYFGLPEFSINENEIIADIGAYVGDTTEEYITRSSDNVKLYAFEPSQEALDKLQKRVSRLEQEWLLRENAIEIIPAGVGVETTTANFSNTNSIMLKIDKYGEIAISIYSLDDFFKDKSPFTLLKADIEGGEMDMLKGAKEIIKRYNPKMAVCIYHSPKDFIQIAEYIHTLVPMYRFYVRCYFDDYQQTILYCVI